MTSRRLALSEQRGDGDVEGTGNVSCVISRDLSDTSLHAPNLEARSPELLGQGLTAELLGGADLFNPASHQRAFGTHSISVSETETNGNSFQTRKRKAAITLPAVADLLLPDMDTFERWSQQLGIPWERVLKKAGVADPREGSRATRSRLAKGGAPRVRKQLLEALRELEKASKTPSEIGSLILSIDDWRDLGAELASLDAPRFKILLAALRDEVQARRSETESPFFSIKPAEKPAKR